MANYNAAFSAADLSLLPLADYNPAWGGDWSEVTDTDATPAATDEIDRAAGSALIDFGDITLPVSATMHLDIRYIDSSNFTRLYIEDDGSGSIKETVSGSEGAGACQQSLPAALADAVKPEGCR